MRWMRMMVRRSVKVAIALAGMAVFAAWMAYRQPPAEATWTEEEFCARAAEMFSTAMHRHACGTCSRCPAPEPRCRTGCLANGRPRATDRRAPTIESRVRLLHLEAADTRRRASRHARRSATLGATKAKRTRKPNRYGVDVRSSSASASSWSPVTKEDTAHRPCTSSLTDRDRGGGCMRTRMPSRHPGNIRQIARRPSEFHPQCMRPPRRSSRAPDGAYGGPWYPCQDALHELAGRTPGPAWPRADAAARRCRRERAREHRGRGDVAGALRRTRALLLAGRQGQRPRVGEHGDGPEGAWVGADTGTRDDEGRGRRRRRDHAPRGKSERQDWAQGGAAARDLARAPPNEAGAGQGAWMGRTA